MWNPGLVNGSVWWELDMENFYDVDRVELNFMKAFSGKISIATSLNKKEWTVVDQNNYQNSKALNRKIEDNSKVRFLKINLTPKNINESLVIGEFEVFGNTDLR